jgi:hypothetical protein
MHSAVLTQPAAPIGKTERQRGKTGRIYRIKHAVCCITEPAVPKVRLRDRDTRQERFVRKTQEVRKGHR